jgi:hypothetical protein
VPEHYRRSGRHAVALQKCEWLGGMLVQPFQSSKVGLRKVSRDPENHLSLCSSQIGYHLFKVTMVGLFELVFIRMILPSEVLNYARY